MSTPPTVRTVTCPSCKGRSRYAPDNPYRPFCSERCQGVDLGAWASERFRVEADPTPDDDTATPAGPPH